ncbi:hypothetical protein [Hymenobacter lucidus]|uniref:Uncharacterized protein n=1 Tax=Hymenobacter lucidus TaxID=2880930 RepID=A0ABS8AQ97_9BACT|nr:hypothetical protein [Hymenobacter lucidus]MCB2408284.1 hypothetical protein [Hymenobacter lucidus]
MLRLLSATVLLSGLIGCSDAPSNRAAPATTTAAPDTAAIRAAAREFRVHYNTPINLDSTDYYLLPISVVAQEGEGRGGKSGSFSSYESDESSSSSFAVGTCYNLIFLQKSTRQEYPLLPHGRFVITELDIEKKPDVRWPFLFYSIIKADTNTDGRQGDDDASALFVSDRSGRQLRQLTPDGTRFQTRLLLPKTSLMLVEVQPDTDHNRRYTYADGSYWLRFDLRDLNAPPVRQPAPALTKALQQQMLTRQSRAPQ